MAEREFTICSKDDAITVKIDGINYIHELLEVLNNDNDTIAIRIIGTVVNLEKKHILLASCKYNQFELYNVRGKKIFQHESFKQRGMTGMLIIKEIIGGGIAVVCETTEDVKTIINNKFIFIINIPESGGPVEYVICCSGYIRGLNSEWR